MSRGRDHHVAVVGGGLVGALNACFLAKRGFKVDMYEMRADIRTQEIVHGRSINLAMSYRGREALRHIGLEDEVVRNGTPMYARMIHRLDGTTRSIPYGKKDQYIMSVDRRKLNELLLTAAEKYPNVTLYFHHKFVSCDFKTGEMVFENERGERVTRKADVIIGCDGAFSSVRRQIMKNTLFNYEQTYIPHGYIELCIPPTHDDKFAMGVNYLHIWPRNEFMLIALPNKDKTYTTTLFMPFEIFEKTNTEEKLMNFFRTYFPDSINFLGEDNLKNTYMNTPALPLVSVKCHPYHVDGKGLIMGDAAHAMVPFYGQGMNAGMEDCIVLDDMLNQYNDDFTKALPAFTEMRNIDAKAICDLAMYNYIEMRQGVNSRLFILRKKLDNLLYALFPNTWIPLYTMVSFTRIRYQQCILNRQWQDQFLKRVSYGVVVGGVFLGCYLVRNKLLNEEISLLALSEWLPIHLSPLSKWFGHMWTQ
ncbi:kynurenine 3-monooxygenase-like [Gigantopelta aegis]|uniref:kynurenine 3-monooxygenase-like n=1 Tax=Gigantopelta aegis TaxID=1735272 RepID=UPI001B888B6A|nr:kynurenine 3-monooxygenase-like [Gigantopelta aegis]